MRTWTYRGVGITLYPTGWYSAFLPGYGFLKADTLAGIRELIREHTKRK
jgi:hypothetical protein